MSQQKWLVGFAVKEAVARIELFIPEFRINTVGKRFRPYAMETAGSL